MAPHCSTLAWRIPWMEEPGGLQPVGLHSVGHGGAHTGVQLGDATHHAPVCGAFRGMWPPIRGPDGKA